MTPTQTPRQIVTERWEWAQHLNIVDKDTYREAVGPAIADQSDAAQDETSENLETLARHVPGEHKHEQATDETTRAGACLIQYAFERATYICPHAKDPARPRPIQALMGADIIKCAECFPPIIQDQHPGACEFCGTPTKRFYPNAFSFINISVLADTCESCAAELREILNP